MSTTSLPQPISSRSTCAAFSKALNLLCLNSKSSNKKLQTIPSFSSYNEISKMLNKNGSISSNHFRGIRRQLIDQFATSACHLMTVSLNSNIVYAHRKIVQSPF